MPTKEIESNQWDSFFQLFSRMERDTLVDVEQLDRSGMLKKIASQSALHSVDFNTSGGCNNVLRFAMGDKTHEIIEPIHVKIRQDPSNRKTLQIDSETGVTSISFHSGRLEELFAKLAAPAKKAA